MERILKKPVTGAIILLILVVLFLQRYQQQVPRVPQWSKEAVWYQIFPERFRNGDTSNDPDANSLKGTWPYYIPDNWQVISWGEQWYDLRPWETPEQHKQSRRYGGDIQGIIDKLDYLQDLGVTALYLNPVFESPSLHKYGCTMYRHIDNNFGPDPAKDEKIWSQETPDDPGTWQWTTADKLFLKLIDECHQRDMKIIIDGVFNHTGIPFWAFQDVMKNGKDSKYADWFVVEQYDDPATEENEFKYAGWNNVQDLPEILEDEQGPKEGFRQHIKHIVERWGDPNNDGDPSDGIDGWRLDVAEKVDLDFWKDFRQWVKAVNPDAYIVGEVWWEDFMQNEMFDASPWLGGDAFDAVMNYRFGDAMLKAFVDEEMTVSPSELDELLGFVRQHYHEDNQYVLMNLMGSHDTERFASMLINPDRTIDHGANMNYETNFDTRKPGPKARDIQKLILAFQFTYPGAPFVYYGDEVGMWGADDPDCRKPMLWEDVEYEPETVDFHGNPQEKDIVAINYELKEFYQKIIDLRNQHESLKTGDFEMVVIDDETGLYGYDRTKNGETIRAIFNISEKNSAIPGELLQENYWEPLLSLNYKDDQFLGQGCLILKK